MAQEAHLMSASLLSGFDLFHRSDFDRPGSLYSAFFQLSTGLERLMKIVVILDHKVNNNLKTPTDRQLRAFGHSIIDCYSRCNSIAAAQDRVMDKWFAPGDLEYRLLEFLSEFASGARYYNLDRLVGAKHADDPLIRWYHVQISIARKYLSTKRREAIMQDARDHCEKFSLFGWEIGPRGEYDLTIDVTYQMEILKRTRGHCIWTIVRILQPFYFLLETLCDEIHKIDEKNGSDNTSVPHMTEFVAFFLCDQRTCVRRKNWLSTYVR
jgi:hypothetical protein